MLNSFKAIAFLAILCSISSVGHSSVMSFTATNDVSLIGGGGVDTNYDSSLSALLWIGPLKSGLLQFDISALPGGAVISSATVTLKNAATDGSTVVEMYQETESWVESTVTWNSPTGDIGGSPNAWDSAAGGFGPGMSAGSNILDTKTVSANIEYTWDVTAAAQSWYANPSTNFGLLLHRNTGNGVKLLTVQGATENSANPPTLSVTYEVVPEPVNAAMLITAMALAGMRRRIALQG